MIPQLHMFYSKNLRLEVIPNYFFNRMTSFKRPMRSREISRSFDCLRLTILQGPGGEPTKIVANVITFEM